MMKMKRLHFFLLLAGLLLTACGGDDDMATGSGNSKPVEPSTPTTPATPTSWTLEITSPITRGLSFDGSTVTPTWSTSDKIYVYYGNQRVGVLHPKENKANAKDYVQLVGNLDTPSSGAYSTSGTLSFYYQCDKGFSDYTLQGGTIASIASDYDYHIAENVAITAVDATNRIVTVGQFNMVPQQAIARFSFTRDLKTNDIITIEENSILASVKLKADVSEGGYVYVALPLSASAASYDLTFTVTRGGDSYYKTKLLDKSMQNGKTYQASTLVMAVKLGNAWWATRNLVDNKTYSEVPSPFTTSEKTNGSYFAWGEITTRDYGFTSASYTAPSPLPTVLPSNLDAATKFCGSAWRMPTKAEADALAGVNREWIVEGSKYCMKFYDSSKPDKYIIMPAGGAWNTNQIYPDRGFYWTSSIWSDNTTYSTRLDFSSASAYTYMSERYLGCLIRPVLNI